MEYLIESFEVNFGIVFILYIADSKYNSFQLDIMICDEKLIFYESPYNNEVRNRRLFRRFGQKRNAVHIERQKWGKG